MDDYIRFQYIHISLELVHTYKSIVTRTKQRNRTKFRSLSQAYLVIKPIGPRFDSPEKQDGQTDANLSNTLECPSNKSHSDLFVQSLLKLFATVFMLTLPIVHDPSPCQIQTLLLGFPIP